MLRYLLRRVMLVIPTFIGVTLLSFTLIHMVPGDPIEARAGERGVAPERLEQLRHEFGFDQPMWKQFLDYEVQVVRGDLGVSLVTRQPVWTEFLAFFPATIELGLCAISFAVLIGIPLGMIAALRRGPGARSSTYRPDRESTAPCRWACRGISPRYAVCARLPRLRPA